MDTKLTIRLDHEVIERAKVHARNHKISLSKMIETYLDSLTKESSEGENVAITPLVKSISGVIDLPQEFDYKEEYRAFLAEKYK